MATTMAKTIFILIPSGPKPTPALKGRSDTAANENPAVASVSKRIIHDRAGSAFDSR
jgi:hypothetical protein